HEQAQRQLLLYDPPIDAGPIGDVEPRPRHALAGCRRHFVTPEASCACAPLCPRRESRGDERNQRILIEISATADSLPGGAPRCGKFDDSTTDRPPRTLPSRFTHGRWACPARPRPSYRTTDRKSTRLNSSHVKISYAVFCL